MVPRAKARWLAATALANAVAALNVKRPVASPIVAAQITPGPSLEVPELRVRDTVVARAVTVYPCASSCRSSAISEWTTCTPDDLGCTCQAANVLVINFNGAGCLESACGSLSASAVVAASELCLKYEEGRLSMESTVTVSAVVTTDSGGSALSTALNAPKSSSSISFSSSSSNPSSTSSGSNGSGSSANDSSKDGSGQSGLTNGAIAGIAVGSAGGAIILCTIFFLVYKYCIQNRKTTATPPAAQPQEGYLTEHFNPTRKPELSSETTAYSVPTPSSMLATSQLPSVVASPIRGPPIDPTTQLQHAELQHTDLQQAQYPSVAEMRGWEPPGNSPTAQQQDISCGTGELADTAVRQELSGTSSMGPIAYEIPGGTIPST